MSALGTLKDALRISCSIAGRMKWRITATPSRHWKEGNNLNDDPGSKAAVATLDADHTLINEHSGKYAVWRLAYLCFTGFKRSR